MDEPWRIGVAIGDQVLDLRLAARQCPWGEGVDALLAPLADGDLNSFMALGAPARRTLRAALRAALADRQRTEARSWNCACCRRPRSR